VSKNTLDFCGVKEYPARISCQVYGSPQNSPEMSDPPAMMFTSPTERQEMSNFDTTAPSVLKISIPDWMNFDFDDVESALPDPHDVYVDWADAFDEETPF